MWNKPVNSSNSFGMTFGGLWIYRTLDSRSNYMGFDSHCWSCVELLEKLLIPYCLYLAAVMGTWWTRIVTGWLKLPACLYDLCAVFSQRTWNCSSGVCRISKKVTGWLNIVYVAYLKLYEYSYLYQCKMQTADCTLLPASTRNTKI